MRTWAAAVRCGMRKRQGPGRRWNTGPRWALLCGLLCSLTGLGCATKPKAHADDTLRRYVQAIGRDDSRAAYQLLGPTVTARLTVEDFDKQWREHHKELAEQKRQIETQLGSKSTLLHEEAVLRLPHGSVIRLLAEAKTTGTAWRLADANLQRVTAPTPQDVLRLLLLAAEQRNFPALLRLLSADERRALEAQLTERIDRLRAALVRPTIEIHGNRAKIEYDPRFFIELVREGDSWRIADLN